MTPRKLITLTSAGLLALAVVGCNLPVGTTPTPFVFPTPNLTMTAIFNQPVSVPPTVTPQPEQGQATGAVVPTQAENNQPAAATPPVSQTPIVGTAVATSAAAANGSATAALLSTAPTIDGNWGDWNTTQYPVRNIVLGAAKFKNSADLDGAYRIGWDDSYLYVAVKVTDNVYSQLNTGENIYKGDSIEILLNNNQSGVAATNKLTSDDYQLGISPGNPAPGTNPSAYLWFPSDKAGSLSNLKIAAISTPGGYRVEAAIPWSDFGIDNPKSGQQFGFALSISDDDQTSTAVQEKMISTAPKRVLSDPTTWGVLTLGS